MARFQPPRGTQDILPNDMAYFKAVIAHLRDIYELYGYGELHTPAFESFELLSAKSGENIKDEIYYFEDKGGRKMGLRFEFTSSLARVMDNNRDLPLPFKRYQIGPVWRYDRPGKGRFREFTQSDVDIVGSPYMRCEVEAFSMIKDVLEGLGINDFRILLNSRKILKAQAKAIALPKDQIEDAFRAIDKREKIGWNGVEEQFKKYQIDIKYLEAFLDLLPDSNSLSNNDILIKQLEKLNDPEASEGVAELLEILSLVRDLGFESKIKVDPTLVRGLDYYTGPVYEVQAVATDTVLSFAGGGRYDSLIKNLGGPDLPATGFSFGVDRLVTICKNFGKLSPIASPASVIVAMAPNAKDHWAFCVATKLRKAKIKTAIDLSGRGLSRQLRQANKDGSQFAVIVDNEFTSGRVALKEMDTGVQSSVDVDSLVEIIRKKRS